MCMDNSVICHCRCDLIALTRALVKLNLLVMHSQVRVHPLRFRIKILLNDSGPWICPDGHWFLFHLGWILRVSEFLSVEHAIEGMGM